MYLSIRPFMIPKNKQGITPSSEKGTGLTGRNGKGRGRTEWEIEKIGGIVVRDDIF